VVRWTPDDGDRRWSILAKQAVQDRLDLCNSSALFRQFKQLQKNEIGAGELCNVVQCRNAESLVLVFVLQHCNLVSLVLVGAGIENKLGFLEKSF